MTTLRRSPDIRPGNSASTRGPRTSAKFPGICGTCSTPIEVGDTIWRLPPQLARYGDPGWICTQCRTADGVADALTLDHVAIRIFLRWLAGKPVSLNSAEVRVLADAVLAADPGIVPARRCDTAAADGASAAGGAAWRDWSQPGATIAEAVGYLLDAVEHSFACNIQTALVLNLVIHITEADRGAGHGHPTAAARELVVITAEWDRLDWRDRRRRAGKAAYLAERKLTGGALVR